eukprot:89567_1
MSSVGEDGDLGRTGRTFGELISAYLWDDIMELRVFGIRPMTVTDVTEVDGDGNSGLYFVSLGVENTGVTVNALIVLKDIVDIAPETSDSKHFLNPLELECNNGGGLLHLAVVLTSIHECRDESTRILQEIIEHENIDINSINNDEQTALHRIVMNTDLTDVD